LLNKLLIGECKWGDDRVSHTIVRHLLGIKTTLMLQALPSGGQGWHVQHAIFSHAGLTEAAQQELAAHNRLSIDVQKLMYDLAQEEAL
jgi:hypothetical protein